MPVPSTSYIRLIGGVTSSISTIFTSSLINVGDLVKITGTEQNNGIFLVVQVVDNLETGGAFGVGSSPEVASSFTDNTHSSDIHSNVITYDTNLNFL